MMEELWETVCGVVMSVCFPLFLCAFPLRLSDILLLNRVRSKALNELSQARLENTNLQNQLRVFQARIAESDARLSMVAQARQRSSILEEQLQGLQVLGGLSAPEPLSVLIAQRRLLA